MLNFPLEILKNFWYFLVFSNYLIFRIFYISVLPDFWAGKFCAWLALFSTQFDAIASLHKSEISLNFECEPRHGSLGKHESTELLTFKWVF